MNFKEFKEKYLKVPVLEYPNNRQDKSPLVTVKLVTYNHVGFIKECLDSILMQKTNFDFEILIAEDDSNDGTREICKEYAEKYSDKIKLLLNSRENNIPINGKPSGTFNNTYANYIIESKYISLIEGDDYWTDEYSLQKRVSFLEENNDFVLCFHNSRIYSQFNLKFESKQMVDFEVSTEITQNELINIGIPTATLVFRHKLVELFEERMLDIIGGDVILRAKLGNFGKGMFLSEIKDAVYRVHAGGIYSGENLEYQQENSLRAREYLRSYFIEKGWDVIVIYKNISNMYFCFFIQYLSVNKKLKIKLLKESMKYAKLGNNSIFKQLVIFITRKIKNTKRNIKK